MIQPRRRSPESAKNLFIAIRQRDKPYPAHTLSRRGIYLLSTVHILWSALRPLDEDNSNVDHEESGVC